MKKSIYILTTTPSSHTHRFHPLPLATPTSCSPHPLATPIHSTHSTIAIHTLNFPQVKSMDDNCGEWVECMGVASGCGEQEVGVATGCGCKEVYRFPHTTCPYSSCIWFFFYSSIPTLLLLYLFFFLQQHPIPTFCSFKKKEFFVLVPVLFCSYILCI